MKKIAVIGNAGGGKSTLCHALGETLQLPVYAIDKGQWGPGWTRVPEATVDAAHAGWVAQERWIIDGWGSWEIMGERFEVADTIIFVDLPLWLHYWWASKRRIQCLFRPRIDGPEECPMLPMTWQLFRMIWHVHHTARPQLLHMLTSIETRKRVVKIGSAGEMRRFLRKYSS